MIETVFLESLKYLEQMPKDKRKAIGQFFTSPETAMYMASMFATPNKENLAILDPGAGSGILTAALVDRLQSDTTLKHITVTCYETSEDVLPILEKNLEYVKAHSRIPVDYEIITENYITTQGKAFQDRKSAKVYDLIICNPPYKKIMKNAAEATSMPDVCYGAPNLYFLFTAMGLFNLEKYGEMVFIIPRSWTSGAYFRAFRHYLLNNGTLKQIHLFVSRDRVFERESVLQETIIIKMDKFSKRDSVKITCSNSNSDFYDITTIDVPYSNIVMGSEQYVYLVTNQDELAVLQRMSKWENTLPSIGLKMRTGLTVDFRHIEQLRHYPEPENVPLLYSQHIRNGRVVFPIHREYQYITKWKSGLVQRNKNYLLVKRFTSKEENRRLQSGIYLAADLPKYEYISTQNKVNFIEGFGFDMTEEQVYGLYVIFNSTLYDQYYRILNGSTQVNSTEVNAMPMPTLAELARLGAALMGRNDLSVEVCDELLGGLINDQN